MRPLRNEEGFGITSRSEEVKDGESGGGEENQNPSPVIWQILRLLDTGAGKSSGSKLKEQPFHPLKSLILHEDTQLQFTFVIRSALYAA